MNTKLIQNTKVLKLPVLPMLKTHNRNRVVTKHFTNLAMFMDSNELSLLSWLIYQTHTDNSFTFSTKLLRAYRQSIIECNKIYSGAGNAKITLVFIRYKLKNLIEAGYIWPTIKENKFIINPLLTLHPRHIGSEEWTSIQKQYESVLNGIGIGDISVLSNNIISYFADEK